MAGFRFGLEFRGQGQIARRLPATWDVFSRAAGKSLLQEGQSILSYARLLAPIRTGALRRSGYAIKVPLAGRNHTVVVGFRVPYAQIVHETHPTRAKFLEEAFRLFQRGMLARIAANTRREVRG